MFQFKPAFRAGVLAAVVLSVASGHARAATHEEIQTMLSQGRLRDALEAAEELTGADPTDCLAWKLQGDAHVRLNRVGDAVAVYENGLENCVDNPELLKALGRVYDETEQYEKVVQVLDKVWTADPSDPYIGSRLATACFRAGKCAEGRRAFSTLLAAFPDRRNDRIAYAQFLTRTCQDYPAAEVEFETLLAADPTDASIHCAKAFMLAEAGRVDEAVKAAEAGLAAASDGKGCLYAAWGRALEAGGDSLMAGGEVEAARGLYRQALTPLEQGVTDPIFGDYCKSIISGVRYKEAPMEEFTP